MTLECVIHDAVAAAVTDAISKQLAPLLQPILQKLNTAETSVDEEKLHTRKEAAIILKVSPITMSIWAHEKRGPEFIRLGNGGVRYRHSALLAFLDCNKGLVGKKGRPSKSDAEAATVVALHQTAQAVTVTTSGTTSRSGHSKAYQQKGKALAQAE